MADTTLQVTVEAKDQTTNVLKGIESSIIRFVGAVSATLATVSVAIFPIRQAAEFQRELLNVAKTTEYTDSQLSELSAGLKEMSTRLNVSALDLAKVAAAGGQLGLGKGGVVDLLAYTESTSRFASVLDVSVEEAGTAIGKISNLYGIAIRDAERIASTLNEISNNSTASGAELIDIIQRIGTAGGTLVLQQSAALAAYGKDLGLTSETVGTTLNKVFLDLQSKAAQVAPLVGLSVREFADLVKTDGIAAFKLYVGALEKMDNVTRSILSEQITGGGRIAAFIQAATNDAANNFTLLDKELAATNKGWTTGTSAIKEQERVLSGLLAQLQIVANVFNNIAETVGRKALPYLTAMAQKFQEFGKDPAVIQFFSDFGSLIGRWSTVLVSAVEGLLSLSAVVGPLIRILQVFLVLKIVGILTGWTKAILDSGKAAAVAAKGWLDLITVNERAVRALAEAARTAKAANAELLASGKTPGTKVNTLGTAASLLDSFLTPYWNAQREAVKTEELLNARIAQRDRVLQGILARMNEIQATAKATAQQAYDDAIASGSTKKAAAAIKRDTLTALKNEYDRLDVRGANLFNAYESSIDRLRAAHVAAGREAIALGNTVGGVMARVVATTRSAIATVFALGQSFIAVASRILGAVFVLQFLLDIFGLLDPVMKGLKAILGIRTEEEAAASRAAAAREAAVATERKQAAELAKQYDNISKTWGVAMQKANSNSLTEAANKLELVQGKMRDITFSAGEFQVGMEYAAAKVQTLSEQLAAAKARLDNLQKNAASSQTWEGIKTSILPVLGKDAGNTQREIEKARQEVDRLSTAYDLAKKAHDFYTTQVKSSGSISTELLQREQEAIAQLAEAYNAEGFSMLKALSLVVAKRKELTEAEKEAGAATKAVENNKDATDKELEAYTLSTQKVRSLTAEVEVLDTAYAQMKKTSSLSALAFIKALGINETTASVEQLTKAISIFGGVADGNVSAVESRLADTTKEVDNLSKQLAKLESSRVEKINSLKAVVPDPNADNIKVAEKVITDEYAAQAAAIRSKLQAQLAVKANIERELTSARSLRAAYEQGGTAVVNARNQSAKLVREFLDSTATVAFVSQQLAAQKKIVDGARFASEQMKDAFENATKEVGKAIKSSEDEMRSLDSYFADRNRALSLAAFDAGTASQNAARAEAAKLFGPQYAEQMAMLDKAAEKRREEERQLHILNSLRDEMARKEELVVEAQSKALLLGAQAKAALAAGDKAGADSYGTAAAKEAENARVATDELLGTLKEFKAEAAKPVTTDFGAKFLVADAEIEQLTKRISGIKVETAKAASTALEQSYAASTEALRTQEGALATMNGRLTEAQGKVQAVIALVPELGRMQTAVGEALLKQSESVVAISDNLKSIAEQDFRNVTGLTAVAEKVGDYEKVRDAIGEIAAISAESIVDVSDKSAAIPENLRKLFLLTDEQITKANSSFDSLNKRIQEGITKGAPVTSNIQFPGAKDALQESLNTGEPVVAKVKIDAQGAATARGYATGGYIQGPGTSTSDSILSWLSHGEYVMDARTTSTFGASFFSALQKIARAGKGGLTSLVKNFGGGVRIPAFANGGFVSSSMDGIASLISSGLGSGVMDTVLVKLDVGGKQYTMRSERDQANQLAKALKILSRSST